jgi:outer membrane protein OmpA-like peptidoglycan-associated protein
MWNVIKALGRLPMRIMTIAAVVFGMAFVASPVSAEPAYKAKAVADMFAKQMMGLPRKVCVGTEAECPQPAAPPNFDLLVNFEFNSDRLTSSAKENLNEFAKALRDPRLASIRFEVGGHTDATGSEGYNLGLSERRAESVVSYLAAQGLDASKLEPKGYGKNQPRVADPYDAVNRRVETKLIKQ